MREVEVVELRQSGLLGSGELFPFLVANSSLLRSVTAARGNFELNRFTHRERITRCWLELELCFRDHICRRCAMRKEMQNGNSRSSLAVNGGRKPIAAGVLLAPCMKQIASADR